MVVSSATCNKNLWENPHNLRMKKELPIAVILLAFGAWCCFQLPPEINGHTTSNASETVRANSVLANARPSQQFDVMQTSWQSPVETQADAETQIESQSQANTDTQENTHPDRAAVAVNPKDGLRAFPPSEFMQIASINDEAANNSVRKLAVGLANIPAFATRTKIVSQLFDVSMVAQGKYFQTAGGEKSRMEIQTISPVAKTVLQMSDGRFVYILKSDHQQQRLEFIDLYRLNNRGANVSRSLLPTTWVMGGGIGNAISHYADAFDFRQVPSSLETQIEGGSVITFRGIWKADVLLNLLHAGEPAESRPKSVVWSNVPRQIPHAIELTFVANAGQPVVPKGISFYQFHSEDKVSMAREMVRIELLPFEFKDSLPDDLFTLESTDFEATDMTGVYNRRITKLSQGLDKVARDRRTDANLR